MSFSRPYQSRHLAGLQEIDATSIQTTEIITDDIQPLTGDTITVAGITINTAGDVDIPGTITVDNIQERTLSNGVQIENISINNSTITDISGVCVEIPDICTRNIDAIDASGVDIEGSNFTATLASIPALDVDQIYEYNLNQGVKIEGVICQDSAITIPDKILVDQIDEYNTNAGVTVDGLLIKDGSLSYPLGDVTVSDNLTVTGNLSAGDIYTDNIYEKTLNNKIAVHHNVKIDNLEELTPANGINIDTGGVNIKDTYLTVQDIQPIDINNPVNQRTSLKVLGVEGAPAVANRATRVELYGSYNRTDASSRTAQLLINRNINLSDASDASILFGEYDSSTANGGLPVTSPDQLNSLVIQQKWWLGLEGYTALEPENNSSDFILKRGNNLAPTIFRIDDGTNEIFLNQNTVIGDNTITPANILTVASTSTIADMGFFTSASTSGTKLSFSDFLKRFAIYNSETGGSIQISHLTGGLTIQNTGDTSFTNKVQIGTEVSNNNLHIHEPSASDSLIRFTNNTTGTGTPDGVIIGMDSTGNLILKTYELTTDIIFSCDDVEHMRLFNSGHLSIGDLTSVDTHNLNIHEDTISNVWISISNTTTTQATGALIGISSSEDLTLRTQRVGDNIIFEPNSTQILELTTTQGLFGTGSSRTSELVELSQPASGSSKIAFSNIDGNAVVGITSAEVLQLENNTDGKPIEFKVTDTTSKIKFRLKSDGRCELGDLDDGAFVASNEELHIHNAGATENGLIAFTNGDFPSEPCHVGIDASMNLKLEASTAGTELIFRTGATTLSNKMIVYSGGRIGMSPNGFFTPSYSPLSDLHIHDTAGVSVILTDGLTEGSSTGAVFNLDTAGNCEIGSSYSTGNVELISGGAIGYVQDNNQRLYNTLAGSPASGAELTVTGGDSTNVVRFSQTNSGTGADLLRLNYDNIANPGTNNGYIIFSATGIDGSVSGNGSGGVLYNTTSDRRLKQNITDTTMNGIETLTQIKIRDYEFIKSPEKRTTGFIAQELKTIPCVECCVAGDETGDPEIAPMMVDYSKLVPLLIKTCQEQQELITDLQARVSALEG